MAVATGLVLKHRTRNFQATV